MRLNITQVHTSFSEKSVKVTLPGNSVGTPRLEEKKSLSDMALESALKLKLDRFRQNKGIIVFASASIPVDNYQSVANRLQFELDLSKEVMTLQIAGGCYISMQGLEVIKAMLQSDPSFEFGILVTAEKFSSLVSSETKESRPSSLMWSDGSSALLVERSNRGFSIDSYVSHSDGESWYDCQIGVSKQGSLEWQFAEEQSNLYSDDKKKALMVIKNCIDKANVKCGDLKGVIILNRSRGFARAIVDQLGLNDLPVFESFLEVGHAGCSDLFYNIEKVVKSKAAPGQYLVYTCGYGYVRSASILSLL